MSDGTDLPEPEFQDAVAEWFVEKYGEQNVTQEHYQDETRWYCDIRIETPYSTLFVEVKTPSAGDSGYRSAVAQALGYAAEDTEAGVPMVVVPHDSLPEERINRLRRSGTVLIREFNPETGEFV